MARGKRDYIPKNQTYLDQGLVSQHLIQEGAVIGGGVETEHGFYKSDHNMGAIEITFSQIVGKIQKINKNSVCKKKNTKMYGQKNSGQLRRAVGRNCRRTNSTESKKMKANARRTNKKIH